MYWRQVCCSIIILLAGAIPGAHAETHALIMTISQYQGGVPPLKGVAYDVESAKAIAKQMGVKDENLRFLKDDQLTLNGMRAAFTELEASLHPGDEVFIYYSGHGGRQYVREAGSERCAESLITDDAQSFVDAELETRLQQLSQKAQKVIVFLDACHSGGVTTRALNPPFVPKYWSKGEMDACAKPVNVLTRSLKFAAKTPGSGAQNYVYIAAARDNEISLDPPGKGGVATQAWLQCMAGDAKDLDGSGGVTADEVRACAQDKIDATLKGVPGYAPHHITITGNSGLVMKLADASSVALPVQDATANQNQPEPPVKPEVVQPDVKPDAVKPDLVKPGAGAPSAPHVEIPRPEAVRPSPPSPIATMRDIYNDRDDRRIVTLTPAQTALKVGKDYVGFTLSSTHAGYVYLLMVGSDGKEFDMLFPNKLDANNYVEAGQTIQLPRANWQVMAQGPAGTDSLLAIVADSPRNFSSIGMTPSGPFSSVEASATSVRDIQSATSVSANADSADCTGKTRTRNIAVAVKKCSNAYGAALVTVDEVAQ